MRKSISFFDTTINEIYIPIYIDSKKLYYFYIFSSGQTLDEAGYASWSPENNKVEEPEHKHCGAISRTGFLLVVDCNQPAMFICQKIINPINGYELRTDKVRWFQINPNTSSEGMS